MTNALTKAASGGALANSEFANPFATAGAGAGSTTFMKFTGATGDFMYGQDDEEMPHGTELAGDVMNSKWVWSFWWEGEVLETVESFVRDDPHGWENEPDYLPENYDGDMSLEEIRAEQADRKSNFMDGWGCQAVLPLREIGGDQEEFTLKLNKGVAMNAFRSLLSSFGRQFKLKEGLVPIIELSAKSYKSKVPGVGKRYAPVLKITDWRSEEDLMAAAGDDPSAYEAEAEPEPSPKSASKSLPAPEPDEEPEEEKKEERQRRGRRGARRGNFG